MCICVLVLCISSMAMAGSKSVSSCASLGAVTVKCFKCINENTYLGQAAVMASYEEYNGKSYCVASLDAKSACSSAYGISRIGVGYQVKYWLWDRLLQGNL